MKTVLYISYDGMTDPLGQSQVIPYLAGLAKRGHSITVLSAEKPHHFALLRERCERIFADHAIDLDLVRMRRLGDRLCAGGRFEIVHCRTILSTLVGHRLTRRFGAK